MAEVGDVDMAQLYISVAAQILLRVTPNVFRLQWDGRIGMYGRLSVQSLNRGDARGLSPGCA